jgi:hypothetical protein
MASITIRTTNISKLFRNSMTRRAVHIIYDKRSKHQSGDPDFNKKRSRRAQHITKPRTFSCPVGYPRHELTASENLLPYTLSLRAVIRANIEKTQDIFACAEMLTELNHTWQTAKCQAGKI